MFEWSSPYPGWLYFALAAGMAVLVVVARRTAISDRLRSGLLFVPRLAVFLLLLIVLLNPVWRREQQLPAQPAQVDFLIDVSRSMALDQPVSRSMEVQNLIQEVDRRLPAGDRPRITYYRFGRQLSSASDVSALIPTDDASRLADALEQMPSRFSREPPRAVVVFSDGAADDAERLTEAAAGFRRMHVPVHVLPVGSAQVRGDVAIDELVIPSRVDAGTKAPIRGVVRGTGYEGERVVLQVKAADRPQLPALAELPITLSGQVQPFEMVVEANPEYGELVIEAPALAGEVTTQNNRVSFQLTTAARKLKVIYMEGTGGNEVRWVREALQEDKDIQCLAMVADQQYVQRPRLLRVDDIYRGFPATREELFEYDCLICSDISMGAFTREQLDWTVELVAERGGGFAMVGGITSFGAGNWDQTVWDKLIPIDMTGGSLGRGWLYQQFRVNIPAEALSHPIWRIVEDPEQNRRVLAAMPPFLGTNYMQRLKPAATALAFTADPLPNVGIMPVFAAQPYGRGRTFAFAPDTTADWGRFFESQWGEGDNRYFRRFWRNLVRWLCENSIIGNKRLLIETDKVIYRAGDPIAITAHAYDDQMRETIAYELLARTRSPRAGNSGAPASAGPATMLVATGSGTSYACQIDSQSLSVPLGISTPESLVLPTCEIEVVARDGVKEVARATTKVKILPDLHEFMQPRPRPDMLEGLAQAADGKVLRGADDLVNLLHGLPAIPGDSLVTGQPIWDSPLIWFTMLGLLAIEWVLRRRAG
jgi:uncharacterized membrane protein